MEELNKKEIDIVKRDIMNDTIKRITYWGIWRSKFKHGFYVMYNDNKIISKVICYTENDIKLMRKLFLNGVM
jgi:hypothetical protein